MYSLTPLETRGLNSVSLGQYQGVSWAVLPQRLRRRICSQPLSYFQWLPAFLGLWLHCSSLQGQYFKSLLALFLPPSVCTRERDLSLCLSVIKTHIMAFRAPIMIVDNLHVTGFSIAYAKTLFPNMVTFHRFQGLRPEYLWGTIIQPATVIIQVVQKRRAGKKSFCPILSLSL